jgi:predicted RNase H-like HicB family nuclease
MKKIKVIIEKSKGGFSAYGEKIDGIWSMGDTVKEAKDAALKSLQLFLKHNNSKNIPAALKGSYTIIFKFDMQSFLNYYKGIFTNAALERMTGINQKQIQHYSSGLKKPRATQSKKIEMAFHKLGTELLSVQL